ncbi:unnamed protein product, partial [Rotaria magnacalcarata]
HYYRNVTTALAVAIEQAKIYQRLKSIGRLIIKSK